MKKEELVVLSEAVEKVGYEILALETGCANQYYGKFIRLAIKRKP